MSSSPVKLADMLRVSLDLSLSFFRKLTGEHGLQAGRFGVGNFFQARKVVQVVRIGMNERADDAERLQIFLREDGQRFVRFVFVFADDEGAFQRGRIGGRRRRGDRKDDDG